jgi:hypothetical protein
MKRKNGTAVILGIIIFALLIAAAIILQNAYLLYAASAVPILLVPFMPDIPASQTLKPGKPAGPVRLYRTSGQEGAGFLIIEAAPGAIRWNKRRLYFPVDGLPVISGSASMNMTTGLPVLQYDLVRHGRKKHLFGIELSHLKDRIRTLSYTTDEVSRLVIRMEDLPVSGTGRGAARTSAVGKGLEA